MRLRSASICFFAALWTVSGLAFAQNQQANALSQRIEVERFGFSVRYPATWSASQTANLLCIVNAPLSQATGKALDQMAQIYVTTETRRDHDEAVRRLREIASEYPGAVTYLTIGGWPAMQRSVVTNKEQPGNDEEARPNERILKITTAIAAGNLVIRAEGRMPPAVSRQVQDQVRAIESGLLFRTPGTASETSRDLRLLRASPKLSPSRPPASHVQRSTRSQALQSVRPAIPANVARRATPATSGSGPSGFTGTPTLLPGAAQVVIPGGFASEPEIAVSIDGQKIVIAQQFQFKTSNDGGQTFPFSGSFTSDGGDTSLAFGKSGNFYEGTILKTSSALNASADNGKTFPFRTNAFTCPTSGSNQCGFTRGTPPTPFPDQEHIAADRWNAGSGGDQVYFAWRQGTGNYEIACSTDSGQNFGTPSATSGDFPRITVGQDGSVYVAYVNGGNVNLNKYNSCQSGLAQQSGFPVTVATSISVNCPMPGLDRCNSGNQLQSPMVAVDDTNANHIYVAYAQSTSSTNENVVTRDSTDGGATWPSSRVVTVSAAPTARRFMPWVCSVGGIAHASWYDRRAATGSKVDLTDYYAGSAFVNGSGNLVAGTEVQINAPNSADPQCAAGKPAGSAQSWPQGDRSPNDSKACTQPQLDGFCKHTPNNSTDSNQRCNENGSNTCPATETCQGGGGVPKYGDYNGNACSAGRLYTIWASSTPPPGTTPSGNVDLWFTSAILCCAAQIQIPGPVVFPDTCVGKTSVQTANICNGGKVDLTVNAITSSDAEFSVTTPSSGYPVTLSQGACFPFQVTFSPTSPGPKVATLTVPSNDPVTPSATITATGTAGQPTIATAIGNGGDFGIVCPGSFVDLPLTIQNSGACPLIVASITSSSPDFKLASVTSFPLTIAPGSSVQIPVRFEPTSSGPKTATISITSSDPAHFVSSVNVKGTGGAPVITTVIADTGNFGSLCRGLFRDLPLTINNGGTCPLKISNIASTSPEFETAQVLSYPLVVAPGSSIAVPIRYRPTSPGNKTANITITSDDPASPTKIVAVTAHTPPEYICHPPTFAVVGVNVGPTYGTGRTGDYSFGGYGRFLTPFGVRKTYGVQAQGEYLYYDPQRQEGQFDGGLLDRFGPVQAGAFASFKWAQLGSFDTGALGQAAFTLDFLFLHKARFGIFGTKGFRNRNSSTIVLIPGAFVLPAFQVVDQFGGSGQVELSHRNYLEGDLEWLHRHTPGLGDRAGAMLRFVHQWHELGFTVEGDLNESYMTPGNSGRIMFGVQFGHWPRPRDLEDKRNPLGTDIPRIHYELPPSFFIGTGVLSTTPPL